MMRVFTFLCLFLLICCGSDAEKGERKLTRVGQYLTIDVDEELASHERHLIVQLCFALSQKLLLEAQYRQVRPHYYYTYRDCNGESRNYRLDLRLTQGSRRYEPVVSTSNEYFSEFFVHNNQPLSLICPQTADLGNFQRHIETAEGEYLSYSFGNSPVNLTCENSAFQFCFNSTKLSNKDESLPKDNYKIEQEDRMVFYDGESGRGQYLKGELMKRERFKLCDDGQNYEMLRAVLYFYRR